MKPSLQLKLTQHLTLTPQLQQSIRLLQLSTVELHQEVERFLLENPLLEKADSEEESAEPGVTLTHNKPDEYLVPSRTDNEPSSSEQEELSSSDSEASDMWADTGPSRGYSEDDEGSLTSQPTAAQTLRDHLLWQLSLTPLPVRDRQIVNVLIDALDEDGYLTSPLEELLSLLPNELSVELEELHIALNHLQNFEPVGIGARNPAECLSLQLKALPESTAYREIALKLVHEHLPLLAARDFTKLRRLLRCDENTLRLSQRLITGLNPRPGAGFAPMETRYVIPDVVVRKVKGHWVASLNEAAMPKLRINRIYADILARHRDSSTQQLSGQLQEAKWLIRNVQQRFDTILRVTQAIVDRQHHFFEHGEVAMRPLVLREIADILDLHESTISRVTSQKFMLSPRGTFELKYFFGSHVGTDTGGAASSTAIRALIKQLIANENRRKPLTDSKISTILSEQGLVVARRTVAKYRDSLQIPPVNLRKTL